GAGVHRVAGIRSTGGLSSHRHGGGAPRRPRGGGVGALPAGVWKHRGALSAGGLARRVPVPRGARDMLDVGGSHGYHSVVLCRRHPGLRSTVLDLPEAVKNAAPLLEKEGMGDRVVHRVGAATTDDFGVETFDLVYTANLVHHLEDEENRDLARRSARALRL